MDSCMSCKKATTIGGQALIEGIMMKGPHRTVVAVREPSGNILIEDMKESSAAKKCKPLGWPIIRGAVNLVQSMITGYKALMLSAEKSGMTELEEEEEQRRNRREVYYGKDANARSQRSRRRHIYLFNPEDMDNADIISMVENSPTYLRDKSTLNSIKMKAEQEGQLATEAAQEAEGGAGGVITF